MNDNESRIPSLDRVLQLPTALDLINQHGRSLVLSALRESAATFRACLQANNPVVTSASLVELAAQTLTRWTAPSLKAVFNLTGTVLHTNLGRAPLPAAALDAIVKVAGEPCNLEFDLGTGKRGDRDSHIEQWLVRLTGSEAATVVNNNAAAVMLLLNTLARKKSVVVSRGELVEIGGSFRVPDVMAAAGVQLCEVGTTNRVHHKDYAEAIDARTALLMKIHTSNYRIEGFTAEVAVPELAALARKSNIPLAVDLGSGTLLDFATLGLPREPTVIEAIQQGADLVTFSGDKLLGGPQVGIIVGRVDLIKKIKKNPMMRALRVDKMTLAALGAVLNLYADPARAAREIPALRLFARPKAEITRLAQDLLMPVQRALRELANVDVIECASQIGSGALPIETLPSAGLSLWPHTTRTQKRAVETLSAKLRALPKPIIGRIHNGAVVLDLRCLEDPVGFLAQIARLAPIEKSGA